LDRLSERFWKCGSQFDKQILSVNLD
jgi:hypothetical protein